MGYKLTEGLQSFYRKLEKNKILMAVRQGMLLAVPLIMTGSIALLLLSIPIPSYQNWQLRFLDGMAADFLNTVHSVTLGCISLIVLVTVSLRYESLTQMPYKGIAPFVSVCSYVAFTTGGDLLRLSEVFRSTWLCYAILCVVISSASFVWLQKHLPRGKRSYADGEDDLFQYAISSVLPAALVIISFSMVNYVLFALFGISNIQQLFWKMGNALFAHMGRGLGSGLLFMLLLHLMWFFGIHGGNVLDDVARNIFNTGLDINIQQILGGKPPTEIVSKSFFDTFALFGGCGTLLCLVVAILLTERRINARKLTKIALFPVFFNMNELILFGLPVILNPIYLIPFIVTPMVLTVISYLAAVWGLVPYVIHNVEWTTPIFLSGYFATGSVAGSVLQAVNLVIGTAVYLPFVRLAQKSHALSTKEHIEELTKEMQGYEAKGHREFLTTRSDYLGSTAKFLAGNLHNALLDGDIYLYYQPQVNEKGCIVGAEALLRWKYETGQFLYPPLVIALAEETGQMEELGRFIISEVCRDMETLTQKFGKDLEISVNLTAEQIIDGGILQYIKEKLQNHHLDGRQLGLELTEQTALKLSPQVSEQLESMRRLGVSIIMDDFGMGHSSMTYLRENRFDVVKLDGSIVRDILENKRSRDIISSIIFLADSLDFKVIAEYVETEIQRKMLEEIGCLLYQGYLFGKPVEFEEFVKQVEENLHEE